MKVTVAITKKLNKEISKLIKKNGGCYFDKLGLNVFLFCFDGISMWQTGIECFDG